MESNDVHYEGMHILVINTGTLRESLRYELLPYIAKNLMLLILLPNKDSFMSNGSHAS